ncbi:hypothetical protein QBC45DRAFT_303638, partial [Copromyces sp. CBS 386.78]
VMGKVKHADIRRGAQQSRSHDVEVLGGASHRSSPPPNSESAEEVVRVDTGSTQSAFKTQDGRNKVGYLDGFRRHVSRALKRCRFHCVKGAGRNVGYALPSMFNDISDSDEELTAR